MQLQKALELRKAKYTKRWKGKDGKWKYEYGRKKKENIKTKSQGTLPQNIHTLDLANATSLIAQAVKMPLKILRRNQDIVERQKEMAYKQKNSKGLDRLEIMGDIYQAAVDIKEFKDETPENWGKEIIRRINKMKKEK